MSRRLAHAALLSALAACHEGQLRGSERSGPGAAEHAPIRDLIHPSGTCDAPAEPVTGQEIFSGPHDTRAFAPCADAACEVAFVFAPTRRDMVYDAKREILYITADAYDGRIGFVLRWAVKDRHFVSPLLSGGQFRGIDLSPEQDVLAVADARHADTTGWVHLLDLEQCAGQRQTFPLDPGEGGTFMPLFIDAHALWVTSSSVGPGNVWLREITARGVGRIRETGPNVMLALSADRSAVAFAGSGSVGAIALASGRQRTTAQPSASEICIERRGAQMAALMSGGISVYSGDLDERWSTVWESGSPVGCVYSPVNDLLYLAWSGENGGRGSVVAYHAFSGDRLSYSHTIDERTDIFDPPSAAAFSSGRLRISPDGSLLFAAVLGGINIYRLEREF